MQAKIDNDPEVSRADVAAENGATGDEEPKKESKIRTPEQENTLYESRFAQRNTRLFEKLLKEWTK